MQDHRDTHRNLCNSLRKKLTEFRAAEGKAWKTQKTSDDDKAEKIWEQIQTLIDKIENH